MPPIVKKKTAPTAQVVNAALDDGAAQPAAWSPYEVWQKRVLRPAEEKLEPKPPSRRRRVD